MVEYNQNTNLAAIFKALTDDSRRSLLERLAQQGPCRVTDLAKHYDMSLNAVSKHIKVLESVGLVKRTTEGRTHWIKAELAPIQAIEHWLSGLKSIWALRLDALDALFSDAESSGQINKEDNVK